MTPKASQASSEMEVEQTTGLPSEVISNISEKAQELSKARKTKQIPETLATIEDIKGYSAIGSHNIHNASPAGVLCVDLHPSHEERVVTGGADSNVIVFNRSTNKVIATASGHSKKVTGVQFHPTEDVFISTSADKTARVWKKQGKEYTSAHIVKTHTGEVVGCSLHPTGDYFATGSADQTWALYSLESATSLAQVNVESPVHSVQFHPDGLLLGTGSADSSLKIWDIKSLKNAATFQVESGAVIDIAFSENGYYLATAAEDNTVKLWDLRKRKNFHTFDLPKDFNLSSIAWDHSGSYLAASGNDIRLFVGKTLNHMATFTGHSGIVTDVKWGKDAKFLATTSMDRSLKFWGKK
jgi:pre-mRNA-processing factor 19